MRLKPSHVGLALLVLHAVMLVALAAITPWTTDERNYLAAGVALRRQFDFTPFATILHGPLPFLSNQLAAWLGVDAGPWDYKFAGRLGTIPWALLAALFVWRFGHRTFGERAGLAALLLHVLNPVVLAHGCLMTADMPLTTAYVLAVWLTWEWLCRPGPGRLALLGAVLGVALATKYLALFLLPALAIAVVVETLRGFAPRLWFSRPAAGALRRLADLVPAVLLCAAVAWVTLWTCYAWRPGGYPLAAKPIPEHGLVDPQDPHAGALSHTFRALAGQPLVVAGLRLLPEPWVRGVDYQKFYSEQGGVTYFGDRIGPGFREYFLVALGTKLPLVLLLAFLFGLGVRAPPWPPRLPALLAAAIAVPLVYLSVGTSLQIGIRYLLPALPLLCLVAGRPADRLCASRGGRGLAWVALAVLVAGTIRDWPRFVGAVNLLARERPYLLFTDSNLDWPVQERPGPDRALLAARHPASVELLGAAGPTLGAIRCHGVELRTPDPRDATRIRHWLRAFAPADRVGAHFLFEVTEAAWRALAADGHDDARDRVELAVALVGAGRPHDALALLDGNADPDAGRVRELATQQAGRRTHEPSYALGLLQVGRFDLVLGLGPEVAPMVRAQAHIHRGELPAAVAILEDVQGRRRLELDEVVTLAFALGPAQPERAIALLQEYAPPPAEPLHAAWMRMLRRLEQDLAALRLLERRGGK